MRNYVFFVVIKLNVEFMGSPQPPDWVPVWDFTDEDEISAGILAARIDYWEGFGFTAEPVSETPYYFLMDKANLIGLLTNWQAHYQQSFASNWTFFEHESPRETWSHGV